MRNMQTFYLYDTDIKKLEKLAKKLGMNKSELVRVSISLLDKLISENKVNINKIVRKYDLEIKD